ncbi:MAG: 16S rRNA (cytosine(1402)-N(4))-methyltransferase [Butyricicoccus sp.]
MEFHHVSILLEPCLEALQIKPDGVYVDATTGGAGHSLRIAERLHDTGRLICIDRMTKHENAKDRLGMYGGVSHRSERLAISTRCSKGGTCRCGRHSVDLGVSSPQLDHAERVFLYAGCAARYAWTGNS